MFERNLIAQNDNELLVLSNVLFKHNVLHRVSKDSHMPRYVLHTEKISDAHVETIMGQFTLEMLASFPPE